MKKSLIVVGTILLVTLLFFIIKVNNFYRQVSKNKTHVPTVAPEKTTYNILLLGYGGGKHEGTYLTDSIILAHIDMKNNKSTLISLPRDLWVKIPTDNGKGYYAKINSVYQMELFPDDYPGIESKLLRDNEPGNTIKTVVSGITGLQVDNLVAIDFEGFTKVIDILDGVDVNVEKTFDDYEYPIDGNENDLCGREEDFKLIEKFMKPPFDEEEKNKLLKDKPELDEYLRNATDSPHLAFPCRYEHLHFDKGITHMDGPTALKYVRSRHALEDGSDFGRAARQQRFIAAVKDKVLSIGFIPKILPLLDELKNNITMDIGAAQIQKLVSEAKDAKNYEISNFVPSNDNYLTDAYADNGQYILAPKIGIDKWDEIKTAIKNTIEGITPTPTTLPTTTPTTAK